MGTILTGVYMGNDLGAIILAAGKGTRMRSQRAKVLHHVCGRPIIRYVVAAVTALDPAEIIVVVGNDADDVKAALSDTKVRFVKQSEQLGTGHALLQARGHINASTLLVLPGDIPLVTAAVLTPLVAEHQRMGADLTVLSMILSDPGAYGRVVRDANNRPVRIVEARDAGPDELKITEVNTGVYCLRNEPFLWEALSGLGAENTQGEYYLTDLVARYAAAGKRVHGVLAADACSVVGVNSRVDLAHADRIMRARIAEMLMESGVTIIDPDHTYIAPDVEVGQDTVIYPGTHLRGKTRIGTECEIGPDTWIEDTEIADRCRIRYSVIESAHIREGCTVGPYSHLRPGADIGPRVRIGNFVEVKASRVNAGTKAGHLTYIGDAEIGEGVNIGAGTITCNYDGKKKHRTVIGDRAFIGSNTALVAPVTIGEDTIIGAGSTITEDVPPGTLGLGRARQVIKERKD